jgi:hypothetical protein
VVGGLAVGIRSAKGVGADVSALRRSTVTGTLGRSGTILISLAFDRRNAARAESVTDGACWAVALEGAVGVLASSSGTARRLGAKVDQRAALKGVSGEARLAVADLFVIVCRAQCIRAARVVDQARNLARLAVAQLVAGTVGVLGALDFLAAGGRVSEVALEAGAERLVVLGRAACVAAAQGSGAGVDALVLTDGVDDAFFVGVALGVHAADQLLHANVVLAELELRAGVVGSARGLANALDAELITDAITVAQTFSCKINKK